MTLAVVDNPMFDGSAWSVDVVYHGPEFTRRMPTTIGGTDMIEFVTKPDSVLFRCFVNPCHGYESGYATARGAAENWCRQFTTTQKGVF
jgi:hypothetical protein